ncbi:hypothetical protein D3C87_2103500 [compost metagenome]
MTMHEDPAVFPFNGRKDGIEERRDCIRKMAGRQCIFLVAQTHHMVLCGGDTRNVLFGQFRV